MKSLYFIFIFCVSTICFGQQTPSTSLNNKLELDKFIADYESVFINTDNEVEIASDSSDLVIDIKAENWDTTIFNPYKDVKVTFPVLISFNDSSYASPIKRSKVITSRFGWRNGRAHKGIDIDLITGDSVVSMFDGIVRFASYNSGHGRTVIVRHFNGLETVYAHLSRYAVKVNDTVSYGQLLGKGGTSGNARGSHLHLVVNYLGIAINPEYLFEFTEDNTVRSQDIWVTKKWTRAELHSSKRQSKIKLLTTEDELYAYINKASEVYVVRKGDTLTKISARNNVSIASICKTNAINKRSTLRIGQELVID